MMPLFFYTDWCPLCPLVENILLDTKNKFLKINFDEQKELVRQYRVAGVPTVVINGKHIAGLHPAEDYSI
jgi:thioredoxin-like negative regulator of GroEL